MNTIEYIFTTQNRTEIEGAIFFIAPSVHIIGSRMTEDGYDLIVEGNVDEIADLIVILNEEGEGYGDNTKAIS